MHQRAKKSGAVYAVPIFTAFLAEMQAFTDHIRTGTHPADLTVYDGTAVSEAAYRCKESFETGKMLPIR